jgi:hypothetical protein
VERLNSASKTSIPALALVGLSCLSAASVRAASRLLGRVGASGSNFAAGPCDPGVGWFKLAEVGGGRPIYSVHLGRPIRHAITSLDVCPNQFGRPKKYDVSPNSFESPERCVDSPAGSADLLGAKTAHQQSRQRTAKGAIYECAFAHYRRREPQCSTGADGARPDKYDDFAFRRPRLWFLIRPRAMRIPSVGAKANLHLRPIGRPWTKTQAGKRL